MGANFNVETGFIQLTTTERDALTDVPEGMLIYNTTTHALNLYNATSWLAVTAA